MIKKSFIFILTILFITSCNRDKLNVDVSHIKVDIEIQRLEQDLFNMDFDSIPIHVPILLNKYDEFFRIYSSPRLNNFGDPGGEHFPSALLMFISDYNFSSIYQEIQKTYPDVSFLEKEFENAYKHYKYYYPGESVPNVVTCILRTYQSIVVSDNYLGISLDKYLGPGSEVYEKVGFPMYKRRNMHQDNIVPDAMKAWALTEFEYNDSVDNLLNQMIYQGKIMYYLDAILPSYHDTLKFGFSPLQLAFCENNEKQMWISLVENKLLFETDKFIIDKFLGEAPFTKDFTTESPGRAVIWLGRQIIREYMRRTRSSVQEMMKEDNYQEILTLSKYNP